MAEVTQQQVVDYIKSISVLELSQLVKTLEAELGVSAAAAMPMAMPMGGGGAAGAAAPAEEKTEFTATLTEIGANKINVIKVVREVTSLGLKEAKDLVEGAPKPIKEAVPKEEAEAIKKKFEEVGAKVTISKGRSGRSGSSRPATLIVTLARESATSASARFPSSRFKECTA